MLSVVTLISLTIFVVVIVGNDTIPPGKGRTRERYRAAVFDQAPKFLKNTSQVLSRREAVKFLNATLSAYEEQCRIGRLREVSPVLLAILFCSYYAHLRK